jgi:hypothetical protein
MSLGAVTVGEALERVDVREVDREAPSHALVGLKRERLSARKSLRAQKPPPLLADRELCDRSGRASRPPARGRYAPLGGTPRRSPPSPVRPRVRGQIAAPLAARLPGGKADTKPRSVVALDLVAAVRLTGLVADLTADFVHAAFSSGKRCSISLVAKARNSRASSSANASRRTVSSSARTRRFRSVTLSQSDSQSGHPWRAVPMR